MSELDDHTLASRGESMLLAAQAMPTSSPLNVISTDSVVPAPTASQFSRELEDIRVAEALVSIREGQNAAQRSHTLDTVPETQDLDVDLEVVLPHVASVLATCHMMVLLIPVLLLCPCIPRLGLICL